MKVYRVVGGVAQDLLAPARETLPRAAPPRGKSAVEPEETPSIDEMPSPGAPP